MWLPTFLAALCWLLFPYPLELFPASLTNRDASSLQKLISLEQLWGFLLYLSNCLSMNESKVFERLRASNDLAFLYLLKQAPELVGDTGFKSIFNMTMCIGQPFADVVKRNSVLLDQRVREVEYDSNDVWSPTIGTGQLDMQHISGFFMWYLNPYSKRSKILEYFLPDKRPELKIVF